MSLFGPPDITKLKEKGKVKDLIKALDYEKDNQIRINAVNALSDLKCEEAVEPVCRILNELSGLDIDLSLSCALALGKIGDAKALKPLTEALNRTGNSARPWKGIVPRCSERMFYCSPPCWNLSNEG